MVDSRCPYSGCKDREAQPRLQRAQGPSRCTRILNRLTLESAPATIPVGQIGGRPKAVAYDDGAILIGFTDGTLAKINPSDPSSPAVIWTHQAGVEVSSIAIDRGTVLGAGDPLEEV
jgi:hypothetical protein